MAEDQKKNTPWKESVWVQPSRDLKCTNFDVILEEALRKPESEESSEVEDKR